MTKNEYINHQRRKIETLQMREAFLEGQVAGILEVVEKHQKPCGRLRVENAELKNRKDALKAENSELRIRMKNLRAENSALRDDVADLSEAEWREDIKVYQRTLRYPELRDTHEGRKALRTVQHLLDIADQADASTTRHHIASQLVRLLE